MVKDTREYGNIQGITIEQLLVQISIKLDRLVDLHEVQVDGLRRVAIDENNSDVLSKIQEYKKNWS